MPLIGSVKEANSPGSGTDMGLTGSIIIAERPDATFPSMPGSDTKFFVSGTFESDNTATPAKAVFGGDLVTSGNLYFAMKAKNSANDLSAVGSDVNFFVSGSKYVRGGAWEYATALFGGDTFISGALYVGPHLKLSASSTDAVIGNPTSNSDILFNVSDGGVDTTVLYIDSSNHRAGVDLTNPQAYYTDGGGLHIQNPLVTTNQGVCGELVLTRYDTSITAGDNLGYILFGGTENGTTFDYGAHIIAEADGTWTVGSDIPTRLKFSTVGDDSSSPTTHMTIDSNGYIGVGTTTPDNLLELLSSTSPQFRITHTNNHDYATFAVDGDGQLDITTADGGGWSTGHICLVPDGKVGIGTTAPGGDDAYLFVSGTIQSEFASAPARAVFGGDLVTSGTVRLALNNTNDADLDSVGSDVNVFVSGSGYSKGTQYANGVALFGGDVVISGSLSAKQKHIVTHKYSESGTSQQYVRFNAAGSDSSPGSNNKFVAPYDGQLIKIIARSTTAMDSTVISSHQGENGDTNLQTTPIESITVDVASANTSYEFTFSDSYFSQGYILGISVNPTTGPNSCDLVSVWEFDTYK